MSSDENSFFGFIPGLNPHWDYKHCNDNTGRKINLYRFKFLNKNHLKSDCIDGSTVNGVRQPILFSFVSNEPPGCKVFCEPETIDCKKQTNLF